MVPYQLLGVPDEKLALKVIRDCWGKYRLHKHDRDDVYQVAMLGLEVAKKGFDPTKKVIHKLTGKEDFAKFSSYAYRVIATYLLEAFVINGGVIRVPRYHFDHWDDPKRSRCRKAMEKKVNAAMNAVQMEYDTPEPIIDNPPDKRLEQHDEELSLRRKIDKIKHAVSKEDWKYIRKHYMKNETYLAISKEEGVTRQRIQQRVQKALEHTRKALGIRI